MSATRTRTRMLGLTVAAVLLAIAAFVPAVAFAATGDSPENAAVFPALPWSAEQTGTLVSTVEGTDAYYEYWGVIALNQGQTVTFTSFMPDEAPWMAFVSADFASPGMVESHSIAPGTEQLTAMAPRTGSYFIALEGNAVEPFTLNATATAAPSFKLTSLSVPKKAKKYKSFGVSVRLTPEYNSLFVPVKFEVQRKHGKYKLYKRYAASGSIDPAKFTAKLKLPKGNYRVRAVFSDAAHTKAQVTSWKQLNVK